MRNLRFIFLFYVLLHVCYNADSQIQYEATIEYFNRPEIKVNEKKFVRSLNRIIRKQHFCEEKKDGRTYINVITVKKNSDSDYVFTIARSELEQSSFYFSKGYFITKGNYFFVCGEDSLYNYPEGLFSYTGNSQRFLDIILKDVLFCDGVVRMDLLYKRKRLYLIKKYW